MIALLGDHLADAVIIATAIVVGLFTLVRGRADVWKSNYEAERDRADRLEKEAHEKGRQLAETQQKLAALEAVPSIEKLYETIVGHNNAEQVIWERVTGVLNQIVTQLDNVAARLAAGKETR